MERVSQLPMEFYIRKGTGKAVKHASVTHQINEAHVDPEGSGKWLMREKYYIFTIVKAKDGLGRFKNRAGWILLSKAEEM